MISRFVFLYIYCYFFSFVLSSTTTPPAPTFTVETFTLEAFATDWAETSTRTLSPAGPTSTYEVFGALQATDITLAQGYVINNLSDQFYVVCWYPVSVSFTP
jgi:hypothetical protein